mmetsp:Transcript_11664/g.25292  ORF Transcript_11664/g.25292 Transcript_11664/m.25292 type:complete len:124 (+) Transcript_11664:4394-4765(+)
MAVPFSVAVERTVDEVRRRSRPRADVGKGMYPQLYFRREGVQFYCWPSAPTERDQPASVNERERQAPECRLLLVPRLSRKWDPPPSLPPETVWSKNAAPFPFLFQSNRWSRVLRPGRMNAGAI